jgi:hypothetical protein
MADQNDNWKIAILAALALIASGSARAPLNTVSNDERKPTEKAIEVAPEILNELAKLNYIRPNPTTGAYELTVPMLETLEMLGIAAPKIKGETFKVAACSQTGGFHS